MKALKMCTVMFAGVLGLALAMPSAWAHPPKVENNQPSLDFDKNLPVPMTGPEDQLTMNSGSGVLAANEPIKLNFNQPIRIPGHVLPAGTYWLVVQDTGTGNTVDVLNADQRVVAALETGSAERDSVTDHVVVTLAEGGPGQPDALVSWFYPGFTIGHEFIYPKTQRKAIEEEQTQTIRVPWQGSRNEVLSASTQY